MSILSQLTELTIIPTMVLAVVWAGHLVQVLGLNRLQFYLVLFLIIHALCSLTIVLTNYFVYGTWNLHLAILGISPTIGAIATLCLLGLFFTANDPLIIPLVMGVVTYLILKFWDFVLIPSLNHAVPR